MVRRMKRLRFISILGLLALTACETSEVRETLGLSRKAPDEFVVVSRPALSVPPDFSLVAPDPTKEGPRASTSEQARSALLGGSASGDGMHSAFGDGHDAGWSSLLDDTATPSDKLTSEFALQADGAMARRTTSAKVEKVEAVSMGTAAESRFLSQMGAEKADPTIRTKLSEDERAEPEAKQEATSLYEQLIGADKEQPVVEPKGEAERLRKNKDEGKKPNEGEVVTEDKKTSKSVLDTLF